MIGGPCTLRAAIEKVLEMGTPVSLGTARKRETSMRLGHPLEVLCEPKARAPTKSAWVFANTMAWPPTH